MEKKSIFNASFEESINLENDDFRKFNQKSYDDLLKYFENGGPSTKFKLTYFFLSLIFPIGINYLFTVLTQEAVTQKQFMGYLALEHNILPIKYYGFFLVIWLGIILIGKWFNQVFILCYRMQFHAQVTAFIWLFIEANLTFITIYFHTITIWGVLLLLLISIMLGYAMMQTQLRRLKRILYGEKFPISTIEKLVMKFSIYGMGLLGGAIIVKMITKVFSVNLTNSMEYFAFFLCWPISNVLFLALFIFVELSHFLPAYYKLKYPEQYRKYEGKSLEEWYGKKYLKKHKELTENE
ncbi:hypothetical protein SAMN05216460_1024 [Streptococcus sp. 45]|uniref:Uncharacterized protein n=1 Tax=Streptococcus equinus TaxID=1335 RepID=A0A1H0MBZ8_STREI|nr:MULTISPECIES: hypothetical protein [Streptococcus]SDO77680.1 hypothetical protein SAMN05216347_102272 [Streptococcus equinus]SEI61646.1 hypothetical protein SAMN05216460_1024 [Streptococcus sp. 45]